jgi:hypothetical protein
MFEIFQLTPGSMPLAEDITVNAVATDHFSNEKKDYPSFALHFSCESKSILCAGDLSADFHDFPSGIKADIAMCELTHFHLDRAIPRLREENFGKLIFTHIGNGWHGEEAEKSFAEMVKALPYPAVIAHDGDVFEL